MLTNVVGSPTDPPKVRIEFNQIIDAAGLGDGWTPNMLANHYRHQVRPTIDAALILDDVLNPSS